MVSPREHAGQPTTQVVAVGGQQLTTATWGMGAPEIVLLHDGLGSIGQWRSVPAGLANRSGRTVMAYDRAGHGSSIPVPSGPWPADWLHREAEVLAELLRLVGARAPVLVGHSDGGSIAAILAAGQPTSCRQLALLAAHTWVETATIREIEHMRATPAPIVSALRRYHDRPEELFEAWSGVWVSEEFATWDVRELVADIAVPTIVIQGDHDEYATDAHAFETSGAIGSNARPVLLPDLGHLLHHEAPEVVTELIARFVDAGC